MLFLLLLLLSLRLLLLLLFLLLMSLCRIRIRIPILVVDDDVFVLFVIVVILLPASVVVLVTVVPAAVVVVDDPAASLLPRGGGKTRAVFPLPAHHFLLRSCCSSCTSRALIAVSGSPDAKEQNLGGQSTGQEVNRYHVSLHYYFRVVSSPFMAEIHKSPERVSLVRYLGTLRERGMRC